jgi:hypothetical protein
VDRTIVVFLSDNGGFLGTDRETYTSNAPLREGKSTLYEGGIRVPLIVRWPGVVAAGSSCGTPVANIDLMATFSAAAGRHRHRRDVTAAAAAERASYGAHCIGISTIGARDWGSPASAAAMATGSSFISTRRSSSSMISRDRRSPRSATANLPRATALRRQLDEWPRRRRPAAGAQYRISHSETLSASARGRKFHRVLASANLVEVRPIWPRSSVACFS